MSLICPLTTIIYIIAILLTVRNILKIHNKLGLTLRVLFSTCCVLELRTLQILFNGNAKTNYFYTCRFLSEI